MGYTGYQAYAFSFYELMAKEYGAMHEWIFMNYGYATLNEPVEAHNQNHCEALYAQVAGSVPLAGMSVLEIGCGRGGGAAYVSRVCHPRSLIGIDFSPHCIRFCRSNNASQGLQFLNAEASDLPFHSETFDAVINIESSHGYQNEDKFLRNVARVLKPDGYFLFADFRLRNKVYDLLERIGDTGLRIIMEKDITENVLHALRLDSPIITALIRKNFPAVVRPVMFSSAAVVGTSKFLLFSAGIMRYVHLVAKKQQ
ncbi:methyltransferase domain-containing protein [bacterium]|nr:methyltransferase domain-containing protein [bacterium]